MTFNLELERHILCTVLIFEDHYINHISTTYGLVNDSVLNRLSFFHVTDGLAPDIMHDVLEGIYMYFKLH